MFFLTELNTFSFICYLFGVCLLDEANHLDESIRSRMCPAAPVVDIQVQWWPCKQCQHISDMKHYIQFAGRSPVHSLVPVVF